MKNHLSLSAIACALLLSVLAAAPVRLQAATVVERGQTNGGTGVSPHNISFQKLVRELRTPLTTTSHGTVTIEGKKIKYRAVAGTLVLDGTGPGEESTPIVAMSYFAYFKQQAKSSSRPITFIWNGGAESSTAWLHMLAYGPVRVVQSDHAHTPSAPYRLVNNNYSLLDASDLVFIDGPGSGFGRLLPHGKTHAERAQSRKRIARELWNSEGDAHAFARFIQRFLTKFHRWTSPKYLYGESYGTYRAALVADILEHDSVDLNGVVLQSQVLAGGRSLHQAMPGHNLQIALNLPTYAATAWYHHKLPAQGGSQNLANVIRDAMKFARTTYLDVLYLGSAASDQQKHSAAHKQHELTGLPASYWYRANLRVTKWMFQRELLRQSGDVIGRLDTRVIGPSLNPLSGHAAYDPQGGVVDGPVKAAINSYARNVLHFGDGLKFRLSGAAAPGFKFLFASTPVGGKMFPFSPSLDSIGRLADAMKRNPDLKVLTVGGLYDLSTPFAAAIYDDRHLPIPRRLRKNIAYAFYPSGHMVYVHLPSLHRLHDRLVRFIGASSEHPVADRSPK